MSTRPLTPSILNLFWSKVNRTGDCWEWTASTDGKKRYGKFHFMNHWVSAHRFAYLTEVGGIPDDLLVLHRCDNPRCVRPDHLFLGTHKDNVQDCIQKGRFTKSLSILKSHQFPRNRELWKSVISYRQSGSSMGQTARHFGISLSTVQYILQREGIS